MSEIHFVTWQASWVQHLEVKKNMGKTQFASLSRPAKILSPFLSRASLQYVPKILFTQATIDCLINNKTENALHKETVILNYIGGDPISHGLSK